MTGGVAAGFSFADGSFRDYDESFIVDADLSKLRRLVLAAQAYMHGRVFEDLPGTFFEAESTITRYAGLCSFPGMQDLLNDSVAEQISRIEDRRNEPAEQHPPPPQPAAGPPLTPNATVPAAACRPAGALGRSAPAADRQLAAGRQLAANRARRAPSRARRAVSHAAWRSGCGKR